MPDKGIWLQRLLSFLFWIFLFATIAHVIFLILVPTSEEWPGQFPYNLQEDELDGWKLLAPFLRHLSLYPEHFPISRFMGIINGAFLTMFIYKVGADVRTVMLEDGGNGNDRRRGKLAPSTYVEWAIGALVSAIIFASSRISVIAPESSIDLALVFLLVVTIFTFSFVSFSFLYRVRRKMLQDEEKMLKNTQSRSSD